MYPLDTEESGIALRAWDQGSVIAEHRPQSELVRYPRSPKNQRKVSAMIKIIVDAMGGDNSPEAQVKAAVRAAKELDVQIILVGRINELKKVLSDNGLSDNGLTIIDAEDVITMEDDPVSFRKKPQSSLSVALNMLKNGEGDALVSSGNSGALLVGSTLVVRCIKGIRRAAMAPVMPVASGYLMICDAGANVECQPEMFDQFALMGSVYMENVLKIKNPRVGLANNGAEECKGTELYKEAHKILKNDKNINFIGNVEGRGIPLGECDVCVCDGFTGNLILKTYEGAGKMFKNELKELFGKGFWSRVGALFVLSGIGKLKKKMDYKEVGGAVLLGISKPVIKAHGSSDEKAFFGAIRQAKNTVVSGVVEKITEKAAVLKEEKDAE